MASRLPFSTSNATFPQQTRQGNTPSLGLSPRTRSPETTPSKSGNRFFSGQKKKTDGAMGSDLDGTTFDCKGEPNAQASPTSTSNELPKNAFDLHNKLRGKLESPLTPGDQPGHIYIMRDPNRPQLLKIGRSTDTEARRKQIEKKCELEIKLIFCSNTVDYCTRTELLIHADLSDLCRPHVCDRTSATHAIQTIKSGSRSTKNLPERL